MKTQTIQDIEKMVTQVQEALKGFIVSENEENRYGSEREYTPKSLKSGIKAILIDIQGLVENTNKFVQLSTCAERNQILDKLTSINTQLENLNFEDVAPFLDELKPVIRNYNIRGSSETQDALTKRINRLNAVCAIIEENLATTTKIKEESELAKDKIQSSQGVLETLDNLIQELQNKTAEIENLRVQSEQGHQSVERTMTDAKSHAEIIEHFSQQVESRQQQIDKQQVITKEYQEKLKLYTVERAKKIKEAEELISQARDALGYRTAEGISASFRERYIDEKNKQKKSLRWLGGAVFFLIAGVGLGIWMAVDADFLTANALSHIAIVSATLSAAWFCSARYVKDKNILEDYSYKAVLAKSIVAFLDLLTGKEREVYLKMVLLEIHKDPLRKRHDVDEGIVQRIFRKKEEITDD